MPVRITKGLKMPLCYMYSKTTKLIPKKVYKTINYKKN